MVAKPLARRIGSMTTRLTITSGTFSAHFQWHLMDALTVVWYDTRNAANNIQLAAVLFLEYRWWRNVGP